MPQTTAVEGEMEQLKWLQLLSIHEEQLKQ